MKRGTRRKEDKDVFDFTEEDELEPYYRWPKDPDSNYGGIIKYQFLEKNASGPVAKIKEVPTVTLDDDDDRYFPDDSSAGPLDSPNNAGCDVSESFYPMSDRALEQHCAFTDSSVDQKFLPPFMQMRVSTELGPLPENGHVSSIPESPCCDDAVDFGDSDNNDRVQESFPSTSDSELEENNDPTVGQAHGQSFGGSKMDIMDTIAIHTDYVAYGDKYFPASLILISRDSVKMKGLAKEEESAASSSEWKIDDILKIETQWSSLANVAKVRIRLLTKDAENETSGEVVEVVEFLVPNWSQQQEHIMSLDVRYNAFLSLGPNMKSCDGDAIPFEDSECSSDPYIPNFEEPFEEVVYPKGEIDAVSVRKSDVDLLQPDVFVNDTIIDFYITYLKNEIPLERRHGFHFFSSFFFRKLADLDKNPSSVSDGKAAFQRVRRWTRKVNIFEKDYIFIPVNYNLHWSLIVLCHPGEVANFNDENIDEALKVPCILHMDSIRGSHAGLKDLLQSYLLEEWKERQKETSEDIFSKFLNLRFLSLELPQQENCSDCGLFLLHYAELFIDEAPLNFSPFRINKFDRFLKQDWFIPAEASLKRVHLQRLIYELLKSRSHECVSPFRNNSSHSPALPVNAENDDGIEIVSEKRSPEKSWKGSSLYSESVQDIDIGLLDMPLHRPSDCVASSGLDMTELLEQCQHYDRGASLWQLGFSMPSIREEVEIDEHLAHSNPDRTGLEPIDELGESHIGSTSGEFNQRFQWNLELLDQGDPEDTSSFDSRSRDDSTEATMIHERNRDLQSADSCQYATLNQSKEHVDSQERYASAPSDMMETPPEDSQELADKYGNHDQVGSDLEEVVEESEEELSDSEHEGDVLGAGEMLTVEDSPPDQLRPVKRLRLTPSHGEVRRLI